MALDMVGLAMRGMGLDPEAIMRTFAELGAAFAQLNTNDAGLSAKLDQVLANQTAMMTAMGLYVPPPTGELADIIATESQKLIEAHGGPAAPVTLLQ